MPSPETVPGPLLSDAAINAAAEAMFVDQRVSAFRDTDDRALARWGTARPGEREPYLRRAEIALAAAHDEIAGPAWAEGHDDGQINLQQEEMIRAGLRTRIANPYPYTMEGAQ